MPTLAAVGGDAGLLAEIGVLLVVLGFVARVADRLSFSPIPFYLLVGLLLGQFGGEPLSFSSDVIEIGAEIGLVLLLFMLGLEFTADELVSGLRSTLRPGLLDLGLNMTSGVVVGFALGWDPIPALLLGGVTYISSSGVIAKLLSDLERLGNRETPAVLSLLVLEDLAMTVYLPIVAVLIAGGALLAGVGLVGLAVAAVVVAVAVAARHGPMISAALHSRSAEVLLLTVLGVVLLMAAGAEGLQLSAPVGAFLAGLMVSGPVAEDARPLFSPLRDLFAATFFIFFGLQIDTSEMLPLLPVALGLAVVGSATKFITGWYAAAALGSRTAGRVRAGTALIARGEFSIVIAGLAVGAALEPELGPLAAGFVMITAIAGPLLTRVSHQIAERLQAAAGPATAAQ